MFCITERPASIYNKSMRNAKRTPLSETREMVDFREQHNITADVKDIPIQKVNEAYEGLLKSDVRYRFALDMASLKSE